MENSFQPLTIDELNKVLGLTIKKDNENKIVTFLCELSAYTENSQFNVCFNAPSSTGKSYIPTEIANLFPKEDIIEIGYCSPTAFFHDVVKYDEEKKGYIIDLSRKILIFLDQPHMDLLAKLRPVLSHDRKEILLKITDKNQKNGLRTKNVILIGYPAVVFCTAFSKVDEQESTRFFVLSPEINQEKIREAISQKIDKEANHVKFAAWLEEMPERKLLQQRILAVKQAGITDIQITEPEKIKERFFQENKMLKPRHSRDIGRLLALVKSLALLNLWWRQREGTTIIANEEDVNQAFEIWNKIAVAQELNLPPYIYNLFLEIIMPLWNERPIDELRLEKLPISRQEIQNKHFEAYGRMLDGTKMVKEIIPTLETAGLIAQESDPYDRRKTLIRPMVPQATSGKEKTMGDRGGVNMGFGRNIDPEEMLQKAGL